MFRQDAQPQEDPDALEDLQYRLACYRPLVAKLRSSAETWMVLLKIGFGFHQKMNGTLPMDP